MSQHVYTGSAPRGLVTILGRQVPFVRGEAVEFSDAEAKALDADWTAPKPAKADKPTTAPADKKES